VARVASPWRQSRIHSPRLQGTLAVLGGACFVAYRF
jgi:hypothetical protein